MVGWWVILYNNMRNFQHRTLQKQEPNVVWLLKKAQNPTGYLSIDAKFRKSSYLKFSFASLNIIRNLVSLERASSQVYRTATSRILNAVLCYEITPWSYPYPCYFTPFYPVKLVPDPVFGKVRMVQNWQERPIFFISSIKFMGHKDKYIKILRNSNIGF